MESNYLTSGDLALWESRKDSCKHHGHGMAATGLGFACGLGGAALIAALAIGWGNNNASKARSEKSDAQNAGMTTALNLVANTLATERNSRESWQIANQPSVRSYIDVSNSATSNPSVNSLANAYSLAYAQAMNNNNSGINSAIGGCNFLRVARYAPPQDCPYLCHTYHTGLG